MKNTKKAKKQQNKNTPAQTPANASTPSNKPQTVRGLFSAAFVAMFVAIGGWFGRLFGAIVRVIKKPAFVAVAGILVVCVIAAMFAGQNAAADNPAPIVTVACAHDDVRFCTVRDASCINEGNTGCKVCNNCGLHLSDGELIEALGHDYQLTGKVDATCTQNGYTGDIACTRCGDIQTKGEIIPAFGHNGVRSGKKAATCTEAGHTGTVMCETCGGLVDAGTSIGATGHTYKNGVCSCGAKDPSYKAPKPIKVNLLLNEEAINESQLNNASIENATITQILVRGSQVSVCLKLSHGSYWVIVSATVELTLGETVQAIVYYA